MHELYLLKEVVEDSLLPAGFALVVEDTHSDDFGSYVAQYGRGTHHVRFIWDGKDGVGYLEQQQGPGSWHPLGERISEASPQLMRTKACADWSSVLAEAVALDREGHGRSIRDGGVRDD